VDGEIVLVGSYVLDQNATRAFYRVLGSVPAEQVLDADAKIKPMTVMGAAENLLITFGFYREEQQIPQDAKYIIELQTGGNTFYVAVLEYMQSMEITTLTNLCWADSHMQEGRTLCAIPQWKAG
jgi:hypothetical protein